MDMKCVEIREFGAASGLSVTRIPVPQAGPDEVLIKVYAAGVNRPDVAQRQGVYPPPPGASDIPGLEVAGEIVVVGDEIDSFKVGDRVCALVTGGGYAEYAAAPAQQCLPIPDGLSYIEAAALPEVFFTVWSNVFDRAELQTGESFLVHGGSSGIGSAAIQLAKLFGATVYTTVGTDEKAKYCLALGADLAINYRDQDFVEILNSATSGKGVDVILDMVGGDYVQRNIDLAAADGRIVSIAFLQGAQVHLNLSSVMMKRLTISGSTLRARNPVFKGALAKTLLTKVWPALASGKISSNVFQVFPLDEAASAHMLMENGDHMGKLVLEVIAS
jgi:NADPH:quinone reductase